MLIVILKKYGFELKACLSDVTFLQELYENTEKNLSILPQETPRILRKATKAGLKAENSKEGMHDFFLSYSKNVRGLETPIFPKTLFQNLINEFPDNTNILKVYDNEKVIAAVLVFCFKHRVMPHY